MNQVAVALSILFSFLSWEFFGLSCGGMISAGYLALFISSPVRILSTIVLSLLVYLIMLLLDKVLIIYGKRRFMLNVILGFILTWAVSLIIPSLTLPFDIRAVGFIIPGLIANDMKKQGIIKTLCMLAIVTIFVKLIMMFSISIGM